MSEAAAPGETPILSPTLMETPAETETPKPEGDPAPAEVKPAESEKPAEGEKPAEVPVFSFDALKLPEGVTLPDEAKSEFSEIVTKNGISTEAAQAMMDLYAKQAGGAAAAQAEAWKTMNEGWVTEVKADPDIGGDKLPATLQMIAKVLDDPTIGAPGVKEALNLTGAGNNPAIVKTIANLARIATEGGRHVAGAANTGVKPPESLGDALYGADGPRTNFGR